jgi:hypothetical protein
MGDEKDNVGISTLNVKPHQGVTKDFDQLTVKPKDTSDLPLDDTHENLPDDK